MKNLILVLVLFFVAGCSPARPLNFQVGQCVEMRLTQERGMVIQRFPMPRDYYVRVAEASKTHYAFFGANRTSVHKYAKVLFSEFELTACEVTP